ncbi:MAG: hypothetical protein ACK4V6_03250 [Microthrixaceae bacterium]
MKYRARGTAPLVVRTAAILPAVVAGVWLWPTGNTALAVAVPAGIVLGALFLAGVPHLTIAGDQLVVRRLLSTERFDRSGVSLNIAPGMVLQYRTWNLVVVADGRARTVRWISWARHDLTGPWSEPAPPPRALRFVELVERSLGNSPVSPPSAGPD